VAGRGKGSNSILSAQVTYREKATEEKLRSCKSPEGKKTSPKRNLYDHKGKDPQYFGSARDNFNQRITLPESRRILGTIERRKGQKPIF